MNDHVATEGLAPRTTEPDGAPRIAVLDMLRGVAILGILFMNINDMGASITASGSDIRHLGWTQADQIAWWLREILANGTARCLLEMLFGAGMLILTDRIAEAAETRWTVLKRYGWRNLVLWAFGMAHMFLLLWPGDILHTYGVAAIVACLFRRLRPRWLLAIGLLMAMMQLILGGYFGVYQGFQRQAHVATVEAKRASGAALTSADRKTLSDAATAAAKRVKAKAERQADIAKEDGYGRGTTGQWVRGQWGMNIQRLAGMELFAIWEAAGMMLVGAALFRLGILQGGRSRRFYGGLLALCYVLGFGLRAIGAYEMTRFDDNPHLFWATSEIARLATTFGHVALINLLATSVSGQRLMRPLVAAGRTALTLYVLQTVVMLWLLFPPFGLGLYGRFGWAGLMTVALVTDALLLWGATVYLRHYRIAPVEWAWRSLVERRRLPLRRAEAVPANLQAAGVSAA